MLKKCFWIFLPGKDQPSWRRQTDLVFCTDQRPKVAVHTVKPHTHSKLGSNKVKFKSEQGPLKFCKAKIKLSSSVPTNYVSCTNHSTVHYTHSDTCYMQGINNWYSNMKKGFWSFWSVPTMYLTREPGRGGRVFEQCFKNAELVFWGIPNHPLKSQGSHKLLICEDLQRGQD